MFDVYVNGKRHRLDTNKPLGEGGEALVYDIGAGQVLKIYRREDDQMFKDEPAQQQMARLRIAEHQRKLPAFPKGLPPNVIAPQALATNAKGEIVGFAMRFLSGTEVLLHYGQKSFRQHVSVETIRSILCGMHQTVGLIHAAQVVIGDFNDLNVLVSGSDPYIIDADSMQFGSFLCSVYTARFVDPLLCDPSGSSPEMAKGKSHSPDSDWYAFNVMAMQCFLCVDPYGGVYVPKDRKREVLHNARPLKRITIFHPEVKYPKPAIPYKVLPDELLQHWHLVFEKDKRGVFPAVLLENMRWTKCSSCGAEHARSVCPNCATAAPAAIKETIQIRGQVTATRIFRTRGAIVRVEIQNGKVLWLVHENGEFRREGDRLVVQGNLDPRLRVRFRGETTYLAVKDTAIGLNPSKAPEKIGVDVVDNSSVVTANADHVYWTQAGQLFRDGQFGPERIGDVISGLTHVWIGTTFGFGFYRAGALTIAFVFDKENRGLNDSVKLPPIRDKLVDATVAFSKDRCWFFTTTQEGANLVNRCTVISADGTVMASAETAYNDSTWLGGIRGGAAAGNFLLAPTDDGVVKVEIDQGRLIVVKSFPDTEPFVNAGSRLFIGPDGLYAANSKEIVRLVIK
jgi:H/ACA ribonucleoprotein complex subunit 3